MHREFTESSIDIKDLLAILNRVPKVLETPDSK